ncbi:unnamed protein product [Dibothriocephalus latus]|uniref:Uncharacterized protein n=1 Tax=Dibothriocephalus latus TaxID=60516 RepID=A0A3P7MG51_DIBLA|nr:unnamed protein product [Dibothriocephalus latus]
MLCNSVRDVSGGSIADNSTKVDRWREHFEALDEQPITSSLSFAMEIRPLPVYTVLGDMPFQDDVANVVQKLRHSRTC